MSIANFFVPVNPLDYKPILSPKTIFDTTTFLQASQKLPPLSDFRIAIIGITDDRNSINNKGCGNAPNEIRKYFYQLCAPQPAIKIVDLGNLHTGKTVNDSYFATSEVTIELLQAGIIPIFLGGSQDMTYGIFLAYHKLKRLTNLAIIDARLDLGNAKEDFNSASYISKIVLKKSKYLFNISLIGYQSYFVPRTDLDLLEDMAFDHYRLGSVRSNIASIEPVLRDSDFVSIDIGVVKQGDAPAHPTPSPNGLAGDELCQLSRYAGISDRTTALALFETNPQIDQQGQTTHLAAQTMWYFVEGICSRQNDYPSSSLAKNKKYIVSLNEVNREIVFYQSPTTKRWWMEIPHPKKENKKMIVACTEDDYITAGNEDIPNRWWYFYQKLS